MKHLEFKIEDQFHFYQCAMVKIRARLLKLPKSSDDALTFNGGCVMAVPPALLLRARPQCRQELRSVIYRGVDPAILHRATVQLFTPQPATPSNVIDLTGDNDDAVIDLTLDDDDSVV